MRGQTGLRKICTLVISLGGLTTSLGGAAQTETEYLSDNIYNMGKVLLDKGHRLHEDLVNVLSFRNPATQSPV